MAVRFKWGSFPHRTQQAMQRKRGRIQEQSIQRVNSDTWLTLCSYFFFSPHCVFRLMKACKRIRQALLNYPLWWELFYRRIVAYQSVVVRSLYLPSLRELQDYDNKRVILQLIYGKECRGCGARYGHSIFQPLGTRICQPCIQEGLVSHRVLLREYGLHFADFLEEYSGKGGVIIAHKQQGKQSVPKTGGLFRLTRNPLDFEIKKWENHLVQRVIPHSSGRERR